MKKNYPLLGIDAGSAAVKIVVMDQDDAILERHYAYHQGDPLSVIRDFLEKSRYKEFRFAAAASGTPSFIRCGHRPEGTICFIEGIKHRRPGVRNILLVGSEKFARIIFNEDGAYRKMKANSACAAGTGSFLDQQALRLGLGSSAELARMAEKSSGQTPRIASRCSVFAKTDLIHAQQEGWGIAEICDGLCQGLARNIADTLFPGEILEGPVFMAGGVALNPRVIQYLSEIAGVSIEQDDLAPYYGAIGAVLRAKNSSMENGGRPRRAVDILGSAGTARNYVHPPLASPKGPYPDFSDHVSYLHTASVLGEANPVEVDSYAIPGTPAPRELHLGIDIGSTSTKAAVLDGNRNVLAGLYTRTAGDPIRAVRGLLETLEEIQKKEHWTGSVRSCATTGSGRKLIGALVGADAVIDEITAHARAAAALDPEADTIIEIGGQDSKFTVLSGGTVVFSHMNTVCAAGTGSFIEEQAQKLGVPINEYARRATGCPAPATSDRCTVFMERDLNNYQNDGYTTEELLTAALFSVCDNYLTKVASEGSIGRRIVFQGATAKNSTLVAAFETRLGKNISVSPYCHLTGAIGAVLEHLGSRKEPEKTTGFRGLGIWKEQIDQRFDQCRGCANQCKLHIITLREEEIVYGYLCGRGQGDKTFVSRNTSGFDLLRERKQCLDEAIQHTGGRSKPEAGKPRFPGVIGSAAVAFSASARNLLINAAYHVSDSAINRYRKQPGAPDKPDQRLKIGIPRALYLQEDGYLWKFFFERLGFSVVLGKDTGKLLSEGKRVAGADFCVPVSMIHGQVLRLLDAADYVFLPVYLEAPSQRPASEIPYEKADRNLFCNYSQYIPTLAAAATGRGDHILKPFIYSSFGDDSKAVHELREMFAAIREGTGGPAPLPSEIAAAYKAMTGLRDQYSRRLRELFRRVRPESGEFAVMLTGRPYTALSEGMNKGIPDMFAQYGLKVFFHDMISLEKAYYHEHELQAYHWYYAAQVVETAYFCRDTPNFYPVLVTSFKCGPDSFAMDSFKKILGQVKKPYLILQLDEHDSAVGYETRIEAAIRSFRNHFGSRETGTAAFGEQSRQAASPDERRRVQKFPRTDTVLLPNWDPMVSALLSAALRSNGIDGRALEEEPELIREAMTYNTGQCIPVSIIAREALHYVEKYRLDPGRTTVWMARALWPCNIPLFPLQMEGIFSRTSGMEELRVYSGDMIFLDVSPRMTMDAYYAFSLAGLLRKLVCRIRPYETVPGSADAFAASALEECVSVLEKRKPVVPLIRDIGAGMAALAVEGKPRPKAAIFGDFYVRDNDVFNQDLIRAIERAGGEVITTSYVEYLKATVDSFFERLVSEGRFATLAAYNAVLAAVAAMEKHLKKRTGVSLSDGSWRNRRRRIAYNHFGIRPEMSGENFDNSLKILKILDEHPDLSLFVQASPAFCCPSLVTEALAPVIESVTGVPVLSITYDGTGAYKNDLVEPFLASYGKTSTGTA
ncbi:BadF/BadG/BcrA/BcrD ATPase family protein [Breznakiella homolactica]|uniref:CoA activase n=1 Tax=Breznakiella homolactica TaxID=2798577 RepID=A0A7T7XQM2_9SPIR|nr:BadF/BadG/BcrA/BcrD ATPase family protein [Breznakiella homolactica]QQO10618.1 acyl-CoA dehydratase activase [Breznakiella homolactica]